MSNDNRGQRRSDEQPGTGKARNRSSWRDGVAAPVQPGVAEKPDHANDANVGTKWRSMQQGYGDEGELPPLPDRRQTRSSKGRGVGSTAIIFGAVLLLAVAAIIILPFTPLLDGDEPSPTPTIETALTTEIVTSVAAGDQTAVPTNVPAETVNSGFLVCIDPGHGGWDYGRERMDKNEFGAPWFHESEVTLSMAFFLRDELESRGIAVVMTRETGGAVNFANEDINGDGQVLDDSDQGKIAGQRDELQARINICNEAGADIMVSLHLNGTDDQSVGGYEVFYNTQREFKQQNEDLAVFLYREMTVAFSDLAYDANPRGYTDDINLSADIHEYGSEQFLIMIGPEVVKPEYTITPTSMPGVIIETLFVTNVNDANFILNPANQKRLAVGWADGIENFRDRYGDGE